MLIFRHMNQKKRIPGLIALKQIIETTASYTGDAFFKALVQHLAEVLDVHGVWVTEFWPEKNTLNALAFWLDGAHVEKYTYPVANTPCEPVLNAHDICHIPKNVIDLYPKDPDLAPVGAVSYMGISLRDTDNSVIGHLALLDNKPMPEIPETFAIFKIFASRAAAELRRVIAQRKITESESKLNRLVNGTSDAIIECDAHFNITQINAAAHKLFESDQSSILNKGLDQLFDSNSFEVLKSIIPQHHILSDKYSSLPIGESLICLNKNHETFPAQVNLSQYQFKDQMFYVLYIKNIKDQVIDKLTIRELHVKTDILHEKIHQHEFSHIIGHSEPIKKCIAQVNQVAPTDANVLILGETGTGKELFAKAVHEASSRKSKPMITLNCAALPSELIESELFGHIKGAFTGAISNREGRFSLADKSTLFLDEIGELPLALQAKLLRVLQEGTYEAVGSSETKTVDVRIITATHRDLSEHIKNGKFREDLYYRLNVFPIKIPPLSARGDDIKELALAFFEKFRKSKPGPMTPFSQSDLNTLCAYHWPGNVRELQNIVERAIITSVDGEMLLDSIMPTSELKSKKEGHSSSILTFEDLKHLEKENIIKALNIANWQISGKNGAAALLQIPRTTLSSKIHKFGIKKIAK